jgi:YggT family protein
MAGYLYRVINIIVQLITILVIIKVFLSYFMDPYHPIRLAVDRFVDPMLRPIRRIIPPIGMVDISPIVLIILIQVLSRLIITVLSSIFH